MNGMAPLANYERKYMICPSGQIWNLDTKDWSTLTQNPNGYLKVTLNLNGKQQCLIHQLVALHFLPNPYGHKQVNHKDGDKTHNAVNNLEWVSTSENIQHSLKHGLRQGYMSKMEKTALVSRVLDGELIGDLAEEIGRGPESLSGMLRRHAITIDLEHLWAIQIKERRRNAAISNLAKINS